MANEIQIPQEGEFIGYKKVYIYFETYRGKFIVTLKIPEDAKRIQANNSNKCRSDKALVLSIERISDNHHVLEITNNLKKKCRYEVGQMVYADSFDDNPDKICTHGIHFFMTRQEAIDFMEYKPNPVPPTPPTDVTYAIINVQPERINAIEGDYKTISAEFVKYIDGGDAQPCVSNVSVYRQKTNGNVTLAFIANNVTQINREIQMELGDEEIIITMAENYTPTIDKKEYIVSIPATVEERVVPEDVFNNIRLAMNDVLESNGKNVIVEGSTTYNYLLNIFNAAETEWNNPNSPWFNISTYQEPTEYNYRGSNTEYRDAAHIALHAWLFAMCLTEIVPTMAIGSQTTNVQTELFIKAQELIGYVPLYGDYDIHADVNIARYVAGIIYSQNHNTYKSQIPQMRDELGGGDGINASDWDGLGYTRETRIDDYGIVREDKIDANGNRIGYKMATLGYLVNTSLFLPTAPGKRINGSYAANQPLPDDRINHPEMFDSDNNYNIDAGINDIVVSGYQLSKKLARDTWNNQYDNIKKNWIIQSAALARCTTRYMFSGKINVALKEGEDNTQYIFEQTSVDAGMAIEGPFSILADKNLYPYINLTDAEEIDNAKTVVQKFMDVVFAIADNSRFPTYDSNYGRRRPCSPLNGLEGGAYSPEIGNPQNAIYNISLTLMVADNKQQYDKWNAEDQDNHATERPNSYPSGHSAQIWTMAMILSQMDSTNALSYIRGAYKYSIGRTIGRAHWMSDVIYGRLFGTMILPIINAMNGASFVNGYSAMERAVLGGVPSGNPVISIGVKIINSHGSAVTLDGDLKFTLGNPDHYGNYLGWDGPYNGTSHLVFSNSPVTLSAGEERVFNGITWRDEDTQQGLGRKSPANAEQLAASGRPRNVLLYVGGNSEIYLCDNMSSSIEFEDGQVYDIVIR